MPPRECETPTTNDGEAMYNPADKTETYGRRPLQSSLAYLVMAAFMMIAAGGAGLGALLR